MSRVATDLRAGVVDALPILIGVGPYGLVVGVAAVEAQFTLAQAAGMSAVVFAGASQLAAFGLIERHAPWFVAVATALVLNLRFAMFSASLESYFEECGSWWRGAVAFFVVGAVYGVALVGFEERDLDHNGWYYLGLAVTTWGTWVVATVAGAVLGAHVPPALHLGFAAQLIFIAIVVQFLESGVAVAVAVASGAIAVVGTGLPLNLGLIVATGVGLSVGYAGDTLRGQT